VHADYDGFILSLSDGGVDNGNEHGLMWGNAQELAEALTRHDGLLLSVFEYEENANGDVRLTYSDYGIDEEPIGAVFVVAAADVEALAAWLQQLPKPLTHSALAARAAQFEKEQKRLREDLYAGLADELTFEGATYRLWARDDAGVGLYGLPHAHDNPRRWLLRAADGGLTITGRPQRLDAHGRPRLMLQPHPQAGQTWTWVRQLPRTRLSVSSF
jgi:hypothetical protein